jgi:hypothetical protein
VNPLHVAVGSNNIAALEILLQYWKERCLDDLLEDPKTGIATISFAESAQSHPNSGHGDLKRNRATLLSIYDAQIEE